MSAFYVRPITRDAANAFIRQHHRHGRKVVGHKFALAGYCNGVLFGVVMVGRPTSRVLQQQDNQGLVAEITRLCVAPDAPRNACSFLYGAARRVWQTMGGTKIITYTLQRESGDSVRGAGFTIEAMVAPRGHVSGWGYRGRNDDAVYDEPKLRWMSI